MAVTQSERTLAGIYLLKVNNRNTRTNNFEHISHPALVYLLLTLNI